MDEDDFDIGVDMRRGLMDTLSVTDHKNNGRQHLLLSIPSIDYALNALSDTILARRPRGRIAAYFGDLAGLAGLLGSAREEHGWLSCGGHFD